MENLREMLAGKETDIFHSGSTDLKKKQVILMKMTKSGLQYPD